MLTVESSELTVAPAATPWGNANKAATSAKRVDFKTLKV